MVSGNEWADFAPLGANKGTALEAIGQQMGIAPEEMVAFGDNENDRSMLEFVGQPYLMQNVIRPWRMSRRTTATAWKMFCVRF